LVAATVLAFSIPKDQLRVPCKTFVPETEFTLDARTLLSLSTDEIDMQGLVQFPAKATGVATKPADTANIAARTICTFRRTAPPPASRPKFVGGV
jgi:hypothetical protein